MWVGSGADSYTQKRFRERARLVSVFFALGYSAIVIRLFYLQVVRGEWLAQASELNRTQVMFLRAPRGEFFDRQGKVMVQNRPSWSVLYSVPERLTVKKKDVEKILAPYLEPYTRLWSKRLERAFQTKQMVRLAEDVPNQVAFVMREIEQICPGLRVLMEFRRGYPRGVLAPHLIGYLGEVSDRELRENLPVPRKPGDLVGKMGIEKVEDSQLRGVDGGMLIEVDSIGRLKRIIKELPYQEGSSVHLTIDAEIQQAAEEELTKTETGKGAAVAIDVKTGAIIAWASTPAFDPLSSMAEDLKDPKSPFLDRVYKGGYPPGSTFKIITAIAGFERNAMRTSEIIDCEGFVSLEDKRNIERKYKCWKKHGPVDYWRAMAESCDSYFYLLGRKIGSQAISDMAFAFGFGQSAQGTLPGENKGTIPNPGWKKRMGLGGWSVGDTFNMSIGQGFVTATPLQVANLMAAMATRGKIMKLFAVDRIINAQGKVLFQASPTLSHTISLKDETWSYVDRSLRSVVAWGTGVQSRIEHLEVHGKTGTAQNPHGEDHAWFAGYAGYVGEESLVAVCAFVENGGHGGAVAAPIARRLFEMALPPRVSDTPEPKKSDEAPKEVS